MKIVLIDKETGIPDIHKCGCRDIDRAPARFAQLTRTVDSRADVAAEWFDCIIDENNATPADYISELHFLPCCADLPDSTD